MTQCEENRALWKLARMIWSSRVLRDQPRLVEAYAALDLAIGDARKFVETYGTPDDCGSREDSEVRGRDTQAPRA